MHILWIKTEFLHPVDKGGRIRTYQMLRALRRDHRITYLTLDDGTAAPDAHELAGEYADEVISIPFSPPRKGSFGFFVDLLRNAVSPLPYAIARYVSPSMRERVRAICETGAIDVVVCDFLTPSLNVPSALGIPAVLFQHNVESVIWERHTSVAGNPVKRAYMREQWCRMLRHERAECSRFDGVVAVSPEDALVFEQQFGVRKVSQVPTGVDARFFRPSDGEVRKPFELVFTGSMDWMPNEDAIRWFIDEIYPRIRAGVPEVTLTVVGRHPPAAILSLATTDASITVTGSVPDVRPYMDRAALFVVPIRIGGGTRLKIFEAMAMECPVVSTTIGAEGLPVRDGVDVVLADDPSAFADAVVNLLRNPDHARKLGITAAQEVRSRYDWDAVSAGFSAILADVVKRATLAHDIPSQAGVFSNP